MDLSEEEKSLDQVRPREPAETDNTDIDADEIEVPIRAGRGMAMDYAELETLHDYPSALEYMKNQLSEYKPRYKRETKDGRKEYYNCAGYLKCPRVVYILLHCESLECSIFQSVEEHTHQSHASRISKAAQELVRSCMDDNVIGNKRILQKLRDMNMPQTTVKQLNNLKSRMKEKKNNRRRGRPRLTAAALEYQFNEYVEECVFSDTDSDSEKQPPQKVLKRKKPDPKSDSDYDVFAVVPVPPSTSKSCIVITKKKAAKTTKPSADAKSAPRTLETKAAKKAKLNVA